MLVLAKIAGAFEKQQTEDHDTRDGKLTFIKMASRLRYRPVSRFCPTFHSLVGARVEVSPLKIAKRRKVCGEID